MANASTTHVILVIRQHVDESVVLHNVRSVLVAAPHVKLRHLRRLDDRLAGHLDGLAVAGEFGWTLCESALENPGCGEVFAATVGAIETRNSHALGKLLALVEAVRELQRGLISAFGWVSAQFLQGTIKDLLFSPIAFRREVGIAACAMHQVDPGTALNAAVVDSDTSLRARGLRVAGDSGRRDLLATCVSALADENATCRFWAGYSAVLLGERGKAIDVLKEIALRDGPFRARALRLVLKLLDAAQAGPLLKALASDPASTRFLIQGAGIAGDPHYVPWLIKQMENPKLNRLAGESFSVVTGLDLAYLDLDGNPPEKLQSGPNDNPDDPDVSMDLDDNLPWPDPARIHSWWDANAQRFSAGGRYFMGATVNVANCKQVLREGFQRQRMAAAEYLCLLQPGTRLFPTRAPAWRQQRWLSKME